MNKMTILRLAFIFCFFFSIISCGGDSPDSQFSSDTDTDDPQQEEVDEPATDVDVNITYEYDDLNRVTRAVYSNGNAVTYAYDDAGNITQTTIE